MVSNYEKQLSRTRTYIKRPRTAAEVAEHFGISRFAAYERLAALRNRGSAEQTGTADGAEGKTGPKSTLWVAT